MKRIHFIALVPILLLAALYSAVARVGWSLPVSAMAVNHGFLMVSGLLGTLISLERTLILKNRIWISIPILSAGSAFLVIAGSVQTGFWCQLLAALLLAVLYTKQWLQFQQIYFFGLTLSALAWTISGVVLLLGRGFPSASIWHILFLLLTIASERLELSRFIATPRWAKTTIVLLFALLFLVQALPFHWGANYFNGALMAGLAYWLMEFDIVKINMKKSGFFRYTGITLFSGYLWLMISGVLMLLPIQTFYHYDAVLHSFFIGFVFSMLFAHAPIIFPALLKKTVKPFHPIFYLPVFLTHALLLLRLYADYASEFSLRKWVGLLQVAVFLLFFLIFLMVFSRSLKQKKTLVHH